MRKPGNPTGKGGFKKGQSGNPGGRPKSKPFKEALAIARALCGQGLAGNVQGIREIADRLDGKVPQAIAGIDEHKNLTPLTATINLGRTQSQSSKTVGRVRKRSN